MIDWKRICVKNDLTVLDAMKVLNDQGAKIIFVVDDEFSLIGSLTDGDIRRGLLKGIKVTDSVLMVTFKNCHFAKIGTSEETIEGLIEVNSITHLPLVDGKKRIQSIYVGTNFQSFTEKNNAVVIMAGGLGSRLGEITKDCPKPLLRIHNKPILEHLILNLKRHGFKTIFLSVNYLAEKIEEHFENGKNLGVKIHYLKEQKRLGTVGSLTLLPKINEPVLVSNGDIVTKVNYEELLTHHKQMNNSLTICARKITNTVPFGVLKIVKDEVVEIVEKPAEDYIVNAGIYILNPNVIEYIPKGSYFDMPSLINTLLSKQYKVGYFLDTNYWVDVGRVDDLEKARQDFYREFK